LCPLSARALVPQRRLKGKESLLNGHPRYFYGYTVVATCFTIQVIGWGIHNSYGVFFNPLIVDFGWSRAAVAGAASASLLIHGVASIFMGGLNDRIGPRLIMTGCGLLMGSGYLLVSRLGSLWELYLYYGFIIGFGVSGTDVVLLSTVARWFTRMRGMMTGIIKVGTGLGMVIVPLFLKWLMTLYSWRTCFAVLGLIILASYVLLAQFLVRDPARKGQLPDNAPPSNDEILQRPEHGLSFREAVKTRQFWTLCFVCLLILASFYTILLHIVPHAIDLGISPSNAANVLAVIGFISIGGRLVMGGAADRIGSKRALMICFGLLFVGLCWLQWAKSLWMLYAFAVIHGFAHGAYFALISPTVATLFGTSAHGVILGTVIFCATIGGGVGPILGGHLFDVTRTYHVVFLMLAAASLVGFILTSTLTPTRHQRASNAKS
jgi:MFS family permease